MTVRVMIIVRMRCGKQMSTIVVNTFLCFFNKNMFYVFFVLQRFFTEHLYVKNHRALNAS